MYKSFNPIKYGPKIHFIQHLDVCVNLTGILENYYFDVNCTDVDGHCRDDSRNKSQSNGLLISNCFGIAFVTQKSYVF